MTSKIKNFEENKENIIDSQSRSMNNISENIDLGAESNECLKNSYQESSFANKLYYIENANDYLECKEKNIKVTDFFHSKKIDDCHKIFENQESCFINNPFLPINEKTEDKTIKQISLKETEEKINDYESAEKHNFIIDSNENNLHTEEDFNRKLLESLRMNSYHEDEDTISGEKQQYLNETEKNLNILNIFDDVKKNTQENSNDNLLVNPDNFQFMNDTPDSEENKMYEESNKNNSNNININNNFNYNIINNFSYPLYTRHLLAINAYLANSQLMYSLNYFQKFQNLLKSNLIPGLKNFKNNCKIGKPGWTCTYCNNFNYEIRIKCNRCGRLPENRVKDYNTQQTNNPNIISQSNPNSNNLNLNDNNSSNRTSRNEDTKSNKNNLSNNNININYLSSLIDVNSQNIYHPKISKFNPNNIRQSEINKKIIPNKFNICNYENKTLSKINNDKNDSKFMFPNNNPKKFDLEKNTFFTEKIENFNLTTTSFNISSNKIEIDPKMNSKNNSSFNTNNFQTPAYSNVQIPNLRPENRNTSQQNENIFNNCYNEMNMSTIIKRSQNIIFNNQPNCTNINSTNPINPQLDYNKFMNHINMKNKFTTLNSINPTKSNFSYSENNYQNKFNIDDNNMNYFKISPEELEKFKEDEKSNSQDNSSNNNSSPGKIVEKKKKKPFVERVGDWVCIKCKNLNFSFRVSCNRCHSPKSEN